MLQSAHESSSGKSATVRFLSFVFDEVSTDPIYLCRLKNSDNPGGGGPQHLFTRDPGKIDAFLLKYDEPGYGLYFCVSTVAPDASTRSKETISELTGLHCDIDFKGIIEGEDEVWNKLEQLTLKPSKIVRSGHGLHAYWLFPEVIPATIENIAKVDQLLRMLARHLAGDMAPAHAAALMRLPGSHNSKHGEWVRVEEAVHNQEAQYRLAELFEWLKDSVPILTRKPVEKETAGTGSNGRTGENPFFDFARATTGISIDVEARLAAMTYQGAGDSAIHTTQLEVSASLLSRRVPIDHVVRTIFDATLAAAGAAGDSWDWARERQDIERMCRDWLAKHPEINRDEEPNVTNKTTKSDAKGDRPKIVLPFINMSAWDDEPPPEQEWAVHGRIPLLQAALFSGEGGSGKSTIFLHECVAHALGRDWLGRMPEPGPALYIEAEDDESVIHRRLYAIADHYHVTFADMIRGGLHLLSFAGKDAVLAVPTRSGKIEPTPLFNALLEAAGDIRPKMIAIASSANVFAGSEIDRSQVQQFISLLTRLAIRARGSTTLISHPSNTGITTGTGLSGTTQWHNAVRARFYLRSVQPAADEQPDDDLREIVFMKNQYGKKDESIVLQYANGMFRPVPGIWSLDKVAQEGKAEEVFFDLLRRLTRENRFVSHSPGRTYAPAIFQREDEAKEAGVDKKQLETAMRRLFKAGKIWTEQYGRPSRPHYRLAVKG
jgi:RecA-family ATPase